jgi:hypothetical protein
LELERALIAARERGQAVETELARERETGVGLQRRLADSESRVRISARELLDREKELHSRHEKALSEFEYRLLESERAKAAREEELQSLSGQASEAAHHRLLESEKRTVAATEHAQSVAAELARETERRQELERRLLSEAAEGRAQLDQAGAAAAAALTQAHGRFVELESQLGNALARAQEAEATLSREGERAREVENAHSIQETARQAHFLEIEKVLAASQEKAQAVEAELIREREAAADQKEHLPRHVRLQLAPRYYRPPFAIVFNFIVWVFIGS